MKYSTFFSYLLAIALLIVNCGLISLAFSKLVAVTEQPQQLVMAEQPVAEEATEEEDDEEDNDEDEDEDEEAPVAGRMTGL